MPDMRAPDIIGDYDIFDAERESARLNGGPVMDRSPLVEVAPPPGERVLPVGYVRFVRNGKPIGVPVGWCRWRGGVYGQWHLCSKAAARAAGLPINLVDPAATEEDEAAPLPPAPPPAPAAPSPSLVGYEIQYFENTSRPQPPPGLIHVSWAEVGLVRHFHVPVSDTFVDRLTGRRGLTPDAAQRLGITIPAWRRERMLMAMKLREPRRP